MTVTLPAEMTYGRVVGRWILAVADTPNDPDDLPEAQIPSGTVSFTRINTYSVRPDTTQADGTYVGILKQNVSTILGSDGELRLSPTAPPGVWLVTGFYKVNATISGMQWPSFDIEVTTEHTQENPLDLIHATPIVVSPTTVLVPSYETKDSAEAAAASAEQSAIDAAQSATEADLSAQSASSSAVSAAGSAASIADALPMMGNFGKNGDFSSGFTPWSNETGGSISFPAAGFIRFTATKVGSVYQAPYAWSDTPEPFVSGVDQCYFRATVKSTSNQVRISWAGVSGYHSGSGDYETLSLIGIPSVTSQWMYVRDERTSGWDAVEFGNALIINLTRTFGAGNEPTKEEMDAIIDSLGGWFDGEKAAPLYPLIQRLSDYNWIGSGSPYGVLTPTSKGIEYTDTAQTNGARKWISTGTTNTSWKVTDGDTGWRNISSLCDTTNITLASTTQMRRNGDTVSIRLGWSARVAGNVDVLPIDSVPIGFRFRPSIMDASWPAYAPGGSVFVGVLETLAGGRGFSIRGSYTNAGAVLSVYQTIDPWPTTLPGTPA